MPSVTLECKSARYIGEGGTVLQRLVCVREKCEVCKIWSSSQLVILVKV